jgi:hypothetical protein
VEASHSSGSFWLETQMASLILLTQSLIIVISTNKFGRKEEFFFAFIVMKFAESITNYK